MMPGIPGIRVVDLHEREKRLFPRDELIAADGRSLMLPETRELSAVELREIFTGIQLRALGLIGYLPLTDRIALNLFPKFSQQNLWRMLALADDDYSRLLPVLRSYGSVRQIPPHLMLVRSFCYFLQEILSAGVAKGYVSEDFEGNFRPKVHFGRTVGRFLSRGDVINVAGSEFAFSARQRANALLKSACTAFLRLTPRTSGWKSEWTLLLDALNALDHVRAVPMLPGDLALANDVSVWLREPYTGALHAYAVYMGFSYMGFAYEADGHRMPSFLFKLDDIFEQFVRNTLREGFKEARIAVLDGNNPKHQRPLFQDNRQFPIKPDAIIRKGIKILAIGEMKYKQKIEEVDRYQVISHVASSGAPLGIWVYPAEDGTNPGLSYVGSMPSGARFFQYRLNISGNLDESRDQMIEDLFKLIAPICN